jgi:hypothetical protein
MTVISDEKRNRDFTIIHSDTRIGIGWPEPLSFKLMVGAGRFGPSIKGTNLRAMLGGKN